MSDPTQSVERGSRSRLMAVLVLVAVAASSLIGGVALDRLVLMPRPFGERPGFGGRPGFDGRPGSRGGPGFGGRSGGDGRSRFGGGSPRGREPSPEMRKRFSDQMAKDLDLTPAQQIRVDTVLTRQMEAIRRATDALRPVTDSITRKAQDEMDSILNPAQRAKVKVFRERMGSPPSQRPTSPP